MRNINYTRSQRRHAGRNTNPPGFCGKSISKTRLRPWQKRWNAWKNIFQCWLLVRSLLLPVVVVAMACSVVCAMILQNVCEGPHWEGVWPCLYPCDVMRLRASSGSWNVLVKYGPHSELFFFLFKKEPVTFTKAVPFKPFVSVGTLKACALNGLYLLTAESEAGSSGSQSPS